VNLYAIYRRELAGFFYSPIAFVVSALFLVVQGVYFTLFLYFLNDPKAPPGAVMSYFFGGTILFWIGVLLVSALLPMRLLAEERRSGTLEPLLTAPVREAEVVLGKYLAVVTFYACLWVPIGSYVAVLWRFSGRPDLGPIAAGFLGAFLVGAALLAWGVLASALTRNQIVAATVGFVFALVLLLGGIGQEFVGPGALHDTLAYMHLFTLMEDFGRGVVDSRHVVFLLTLTTLGLYFAVKALELKKGA
jgi:ABC-2 type transport system permease protein